MNVAALGTSRKRWAGRSLRRRGQVQQPSHHFADLQYLQAHPLHARLWHVLQLGARSVSAARFIRNYLQEEKKAAKQRRNSNKWIFVASANMTQFFIAAKVCPRRSIVPPVLLTGWPPAAEADMFFTPQVSAAAVRRGLLLVQGTRGDGSSSHKCHVCICAEEGHVRAQLLHGGRRRRCRRPAGGGPWPHRQARAHVRRVSKLETCPFRHTHRQNPRCRLRCGRICAFTRLSWTMAAV